jgi:ABC-type lipoprotein export system ATPase subunit
VQALTKLVEDRTVIMTTHRPALTALATRTVYLRRGGYLESEPRNGVAMTDHDLAEEGAQ